MATTLETVVQEVEVVQRINRVCLSRSGSRGPAGEDGADGRTILSGAVDPTIEGVDGDFYLNTATSVLFGPKNVTWPSGVSLVGPQGPQGQQGETGPAGEDGADGRTLLSGVVDPTTEGEDGDFYINTATTTLFGPKDTTWPAGVSLIGLTGPASSVDENIPIFDGVAGNLLKDSGVKLSDKANVTDVTDGLALKADITYVEYLMMEGDPA